MSYLVLSIKTLRVRNWDIRLLPHGIDLVRYSPRIGIKNVYLPLGDGYDNPILTSRFSILPKYIKKFLIRKGYLPKTFTSLI